jgi:hypothetical protein
MCDLNYLPLPRVIGGCHHPIVLNNACSSWRALAMTFGCGGASVYIGTTTDILGASVGVITANKFAQAVTSGKAVGPALFRSQRNLITEFGYTPYLMHGYIYTQLSNPSYTKRRRRVQQRLASAMEALARLPSSNKELAAMVFLTNELKELLNA